MVEFIKRLRGSVAALGLGLCLATGAQGQGLTIREDRGGRVVEYISKIRDLARTGTEVRIEGLCISACTLYLGLKTSCVREEARLGFHGPASAFGGFPLPKSEFERISRQMAEHYPKRIRSWFMSTARYELKDYYVLSGSEAIAMGAKRCV